MHQLSVKYATYTCCARNWISCAYNVAINQLPDATLSAAVGYPSPPRVDNQQLLSEIYMYLIISTARRSIELIDAEPELAILLVTSYYHLLLSSGSPHSCCNIGISFSAETRLLAL